MRLQSARAAKAEELSSDLMVQRASRVAEFGAFADVEVYTPSKALGVCAGRGPGQYHLWAAVSTEAEAQLLVEKYGREVEVRVIQVQGGPDVGTASSSNYTRQRHRPLEAGLSIAPLGAGWSGTAGFFHGNYLVTNHHVAEASVGTPIVQPSGPDSVGGSNPGNVIGILDKLPPINYAGGVNLVDCARVALRDEPGDWTRHNAAIQGEVAGFRALTPDDLGRQVRKIGRTTEATLGTVTAIEVDGLRVNYGASGVAVFNDQHEFSLPGAGAFSASGDSGSAILIDDEIVSLLFAGGTDAAGHDRTFGNPIMRVLDALEITP